MAMRKGNKCIVEGIFLKLSFEKEGTTKGVCAEVDKEDKCFLRSE
jgi:hypothetical protein